MKKHHHDFKPVGAHYDWCKICGCLRQHLVGGERNGKGDLKEYAYQYHENYKTTQANRPRKAWNED